eukprot:366570-Chlamydomonas_euryale.AAC.7
MGGFACVTRGLDMPCRATTRGGSRHSRPLVRAAILDVDTIGDFCPCQRPNRLRRKFIKVCRPITENISPRLCPPQVFVSFCLFFLLGGADLVCPHEATLRLPSPSRSVDTFSSELIVRAL